MLHMVQNYVCTLVNMLRLGRGLKIFECTRGAQEHAFCNAEDLPHSKAVTFVFA